MSEFSKSIEQIRLIAHVLGDLNKETLYVGGATVPFYIPQVYWPQARATEDVDIVLEIMSHQENWKLDETLRAKGFINDIREGAPLCRWISQGITVDIMSVDENIFGFTNRWYKEGFEKAIQVKSPLPDVKILSFPYFLATKIEAFHGRGREDYLGSHDMEDIISVLEVFPKENILENMNAISTELRKYLKKELADFRKSQKFLDAIPGAVFNRLVPEEGAKNVLSSIDVVIGICQSE